MIDRRSPIRITVCGIRELIPDGDIFNHPPEGPYQCNSPNRWVACVSIDLFAKNPTPTRAEASDVATAIYDGADGIMLSAESAAGKYPRQSVEMQRRIITAVENDPVSLAGTLDGFLGEGCELIASDNAN